MENICNICGANLIEENGRWKCPACGAYEVLEITSEEKTLLTVAGQDLRRANFDDAEERYDDITRQYPANCMGYWGLVLAKYGIKYEEDYNGKKIPTCYSISYESFLADNNYKKAYKLADKKNKEYFKNQANKIEEVRKEWVAIAENEPQYDIFISYKDTDESGVAKTEDSTKALELYYFLSQNGYKVFLSSVTLKDKTGEKYEPYIFNAINTAKVMIVYGSKPEYINATWVRNEWTRFYKRISENKKLKNSLVVVYNGFNPNELPKPLNRKQGFDAQSTDYLINLLNHVKRIVQESTSTLPKITRKEILPLEKDKAEKLTTVDVSNKSRAIYQERDIVEKIKIDGNNIPRIEKSTKSKLNIIDKYLEKEEFLEVIDECDKILYKEQTNGAVLKYKLLAEKRCRSLEELSKKERIDSIDIEKIKSILIYQDEKDAEIIFNMLANLIKDNLNNRQHLQVIKKIYNEIVSYDTEVVTNLRLYLFKYASNLSSSDLEVDINFIDNYLKYEQDAYNYISALELVTKNAIEKGERDIAQYYYSKLQEIDKDGYESQLIGLLLNYNVKNVPELINKINTKEDFELLDEKLNNTDQESMEKWLLFRKHAINILLIKNQYSQMFKWMDNTFKFATKTRIEDISALLIAIIENASTRISKYVEQFMVYLEIVLKQLTSRSQFTYLNTLFEKCIKNNISQKGNKGIVDIFIALLSYVRQDYEDAMLTHMYNMAENLLSFRMFDDAKRLYELIIGIDNENHRAYWGLLKAKIQCSNDLDISKCLIPIGEFNEYNNALDLASENDNSSLEKYIEIYSNQKNYILQKQEEERKKREEEIRRIETERRIKELEEQRIAKEKEKKEAIYEKALLYKNKKDYNNAILTFNKISTYNDSLEQIKLCKEAIKRKKTRKNIFVISMVLIIIITIIIGSAIAVINENKQIEEFRHTAPNIASQLAEEGKYSEAYDIMQQAHFQNERIAQAYYYASKCNWKEACEYGLTTIIIPQGVTSIGNSAFYYCRSLASVAIPSSVTSIGSSAFKGCSSLTSIDIPGTVTSIGSSAFEDCSSLASVAIPSSVTSIGNHAFKYCSSLTSIDIPSSVTSIGGWAFYGCNNLTKITLPMAFSHIGDIFGRFGDIYGDMYSGYNNYEKTNTITTSLKEIVINGGASIDSYAFSGCTSLTSMDIPSNITSIGRDAFKGCSNLTIYCEASSKPSGWDYAWNSSKRPVKWGVSGKILNNGLVYSLCPDKTLQIIEYKGTDKNIEIPKEINGKKVTSIGKSAFHGCSSLTSIIIPEGVTSIGNSAFEYCSSLTSIVLPSCVTNIGDCAFSSCINLTSITIPDGLTTIGKRAFSGCNSLASIVLPSTVTDIGNNTFSGCDNLAKITLPMAFSHIGDIFGGYSNYENTIPTSLKEIEINGGTSVEYSAFSGCSSLASITIPNSVTGIGNNAFSGCDNLAKITLPMAFSHIGNIFGGYSNYENTIPTSLKEIEINGGKNIGSYAFDGCSSLSSITIPNSVTTIGSSAFARCSSLTSIDIPNSVTSIGWYVFDGCNGLANITLEQGDTKYHSKDNCIIETATNTLITGCKNSTIPNYVTNIENFAFYNCSSLTSIVIPNSVISIGDRAFFGCNSLTKITLPMAFSHIGNIFGGYSNYENTIPTSLKEIEINGGKNIGSYAFSECSSLASITIPTSVTGIGNNAFDGCSSLTNIVVPSSVINIEHGAFARCSSLTSIVIPNSVTSIGNCAFYQCNSLTSITIPDGLTSIGYDAFYQCNSLTSITIPDGLTSIGYDAFYQCNSLTSINIPNTVTDIGNNAFSDCDNLAKITLPMAFSHIGDIFGGYSNYENTIPISLKEIGINGGKNIGDYAFKGCPSITSITIPDSVTSIGDYAFKGCNNLTKITFPMAFAHIGDIFGGYSNYENTIPTALKEIEINGGKSVGDYAFKGCTGLTSVIILDSVTSIGYMAFTDCNSLTSIDIPSSITSIGNDAFSGCNNLTSIVIPSSVSCIGDYAFKGCTSLTSITIPNSVTNIGRDAFYRCDNLTKITFPMVFAHIGDIFGGYSNYENTIPTALKEIVINGGKSVGDYAFKGCTSITSITIPDSVTSIGYMAFIDCNSLKSIDIPRSITSIGSYAFYECSSLISIDISSSVTSIGNDAFFGCSNLTIYCEASSKQSGWDDAWNSSNRPVVWRYGKI